MPSDKLIAQAWLRDLKTGGVRRYSTHGVLIAVISRHATGWKWSVLSEAGTMLAISRETAKGCADAALRRAGWQLVNVPGGCAIEKE